MYDVSQGGAGRFLSDVIRLFSGTLRAMLGVSLFRLFLAVLLFLALAGMLGWMFHLGRNGRL